MAHCYQSCNLIRNLVSILFNGTKKNIFLCFIALFLKNKNNINVNVVTLAQITFPDTLRFPILGERTLKATAKPQQQDS